MIVRGIISSFISVKWTLPTEAAKESMASRRRVISSKAQQDDGEDKTYNMNKRHAFPANECSRFSNQQGTLQP
jgi:hypothetical protein